MNHPALLVSGTETVLVVSLQGQRPLEQVFLNAALVFALLLALLAAAAAAQTPFPNDIRPAWNQTSATGFSFQVNIWKEFAHGTVHSAKAKPRSLRRAH